MANRRVERYLATVNSHLHGLPALEREQQIEELRQHLSALIDDFRAQVQGDDDATDAALQRFGGPEQVGSLLESVWSKNQRPSLWLYVGLYLVAVAFVLGVFVTANDQPTDFPYGLPAQVLLALVLPAGTLAIGLFRYLDSSRLWARK